MGSKRVAISEVQIGMYVTGFDRSWFRTPFLRHRFLITSSQQIDKLRSSGIREVTIDPEKSAIPVAADQPATEPSTCEAASSLASAPPLQPAAQGTKPPRQPAHKSLDVLNREFALAKEARERLAQTVHRLFERFESEGIVLGEDVVEAAKEITIVTNTLTNPAVFMAMSQGRGCDRAMSNHALVSCTLSLLLGQAAKLDLLQLHNLAMGALLHDVGLLLLPRHLTDGLRNTSRPLSAQDQALYESHPRRGAVYLEQEGNFPLDVRRIVAEHHATGDGKGFPRETNPAWTEPTSRILMIADRYDELLSGFGGATPLQPHQALQRLYRDTHDRMLDADLTSLFIKRVGVFPIHSVVELNTGERAVVTDINPDALHLPVVHITHEASGLALIAPARIDLARQALDKTARSISRVVDSATPPACAGSVADLSASGAAGYSSASS